MKPLSLRYGPTVPHLSTQIVGQDYQVDFIKMLTWQAHADALTNLRTWGILTDAETNKARQRITKQVTKIVTPRKKPV